MHREFCVICWHASKATLTQGRSVFLSIYWSCFCSIINGLSSQQLPLDQKERDVNWLWKQIWISKSTKQTWRDRNEQNVCPLWCQSFGFLPIGHGPLAVELPALLYAGCSVPMTSLTSGSQAWSQQLRLRNPPCFQAFALHFGKKSTY